MKEPAIAWFRQKNIARSRCTCPRRRSKIDCLQVAQAEHRQLFVINFIALCIFSKSIAFLNMNSIQATQVRVRAEFLQKCMADDSFPTISIFS